MSKIDDLLADEGAATENHELPDPLPADVAEHAEREDTGGSVPERLARLEREVFQHTA